MQVSPVQGPPATTAVSGGLAASTSTTVDFQSFLRLLTAQLRNQDPLSPLDSTQFVAQLANFSTVEQLVSANARLDRIAESFSSGVLEDYANWIGKAAEIKGAPVLYAGSPTPYRLDPLFSAVSVDLVVRDLSGAVVHRSTIDNNDKIQQWLGAVGREGEPFILESEFTLDDGAKVIRPVSTFDVITAVRQDADSVVFSLASGFTAPRATVRGLSSHTPI
ncbi:MAG: flagellar hook capping FlgD N-terminal domain-containing protein [Parvularculaceae bacterium]